MGNASVIYTQVTLDAGSLDPHANVTHDDGTHTIALSGLTIAGHAYLNGTLDELAKFVLDLAGVVRELNARELDAIHGRTLCPVCNTDTVHDADGICQGVNGAGAPVQNVVDELQARR